MLSFNCSQVIRNPINSGANPVQPSTAFEHEGNLDETNPQDILDILIKQVRNHTSAIVKHFEFM